MKTIWKNMLPDVDIEYYDNNKHNVYAYVKKKKKKKKKKKLRDLG